MNCIVFFQRKCTTSRITRYDSMASSGQHTLAVVLGVRKNVSKQSSWYLCHWTFKKPNLIGWLILFFNFSLRREMQVCGGSQYAFF